MTALNMAKHRNNPNFAFWKMIKDGYDHFEASHQEPKVAVCEKRYVFDPAAPANASKPLSFNAAGKCPVYQLDPAVADAVLDYRRQEQTKMAEYIARDVAVVPSRAGIDGGMNPVFASKLAAHIEFDNNGRTYQLAGNTQAPGALPRTTVGPAAPISIPQAVAEPVETEQPVVTSVRMPQPAPRPKEGEAPAEKPTSIAGLLGNVFSAKSTEPQPAAEAPVEVSAPVSPRKTEVAKIKQPAPAFRTASGPASKQDAAPKAVAEAAPQLRLKQADKNDAPRAPEREMRTAYSAPPQASSNGLLTGAQPVVPVGSFDSRWSGFR